MTPRSDGRCRPGVSLVEAIVATVILGVGVLGAVATAALAARLAREAAARAEAVTLAGAVLDSLLDSDAPVAGERRTPGVVARWAVQPGEGVTAIDLVVEHHDGTRLRRRRFAMLHAPAPRLAEGDR